ncbi:SAM-dependent methyltransferase [Veronia nyctiphanis]|uniref:SAM-dependent methyltransferase n=1 Tax=Veronia nyctiphanis TaxID=1278244 RepID=A0A4Q0YZ60_9GAMM|nr:methyltransferase domain-containing protein [Veronia nyctiphanis]RXJ74411.1 SAM-dependent methyltransferase [Veronia nyctiphanis]
MAGSAEATSLPSGSVDLITAAQAFHWFNNAESQKEFRRILRPDGLVAVIWNKRDLRSAFHRDYDNLLKQYASDYAKVTHLQIKDAEVEAFFAHFEGKEIFPHHQQMDFEQLLGRLRSSSYCPDEGSEAYSTLTKAMKALFEKYKQKGFLSFEYQTCVYLGKM